VGRVLAVDWGKRRLGLAVSDPTGLIAQALRGVEVHGQRHALDQVCEAAREWEAEAVVVGLPLLMDGTEGQAAREVRSFAEALAARSGLPVATLDERLTTVQAERALREGRGRRGAAAGRRARARADVDVAAAVLLLQSYLDRSRPAGPEPGVAP
jgi:putative Holliday junction resolvase